MNMNKSLHVLRLRKKVINKESINTNKVINSSVDINVQNVNNSNIKINIDNINNSNIISNVRNLNVEDESEESESNSNDDSLESVDGDVDTDELINKLNELALNGDDYAWYESKTIRGKPKLISNGFAYIIDKELEYIYWKCEKKNCSGRAKSTGKVPPLTITQAHSDWHHTDCTRLDQAKRDDRLRESAGNRVNSRVIIKDILKDNSDALLAKNPSASAMRQRITRYKKKSKLVFKEPTDLVSLTIPDVYKKTYKGAQFLMGDSLELYNNNSDRVLLFSTSANMKLLSNNRNWLSDGTFKIVPHIFYQLYTIFIVLNNFTLPLAYGLLPNKKKKTYKTFFKLISCNISTSPLSINVDFERAVFGAVKEVFGVGVEIYGCFFHLSQSFFRRVKEKGFYINYMTNPFFKKCYLLSQALCFLPTSDVIDGFNLVYDYAFENCTEYLDFLDYIEKFYIGEKDKNTGMRKNPFFPIETWNLYIRIVQNKPRTNNTVERWNKQIQSDSGEHHLGIIDFIESLRLEQGITESNIVLAKTGVENKKKIKQIDVDNQFINCLKLYNPNDKFDFLCTITSIIEKHNENEAIKILEKKQKINDIDESE